MRFILFPPSGRTEVHMSTSQSQTSSPNQRRRRKFVLALDLGTTKIKASIFDQVKVVEKVLILEFFIHFLGP